MNLKIFKNLKQYTLTSSIKKEDIDLVKKYRPDALKKKDTEGNDVFAISYVEGKPCIAANGVTFGATDVDNGAAMIIGTIPALPAGTTAGDYVADKVGSALGYINEFEAGLPTIVNEIKTSRAALINSIVEA